MFLALSIIGIVLSSLLLYFNLMKYNTSIYLSVFFLLIGYYVLAQNVLLNSKSVFLVAAVFIHAGIPVYLIGPFFFFYVRSVLNDDTKLKKSDWVHLLPMVIYIFEASEYFFSPWSFKLEMAGKIVNNILFQAPYSSGIGLIFHHIPAEIVYLSRPVIVFLYLLWSAVMLIRYLQYRKEKSVLRKQQFMIKWLWILMGFLFLLVSSQIIQLIIAFTVMDMAVLLTMNMLQIIAATGLTGLLISPFFFPEILYGMPQFPHAAGQVERTGFLAESEQVKQIKPVSKFEDEYLELIEKKINETITDYQPYLQPDFNLAKLSVLLNIPIHHLSWYFREIKLQSFTDFRNELRVKHSVKLISDGDTTGLTLEAIGMISGFSNRNTFLTAFKKFQGITPKEFMNQNRG